jgi:hypothetical protein
MSTATAGAPTTAAVKSIELFLEGVTLLRYDFGASNEHCSFVVNCPDGTSLWCQQTPEIDQQGKVHTLPEIIADRVVMTYVDGKSEERVCQSVTTAAPEREESSTARW